MDTAFHNSNELLRCDVTRESFVGGGVFPTLGWSLLEHKVKSVYTKQWPKLSPETDSLYFYSVLSTH